MNQQPEPWLRGPLHGTPPAIAPLLRSFEEVREDLRRHTAGLTTEQVWARPHGLSPLGFHLRHIAGSVDRLVTYLEGRQMSDLQMAALRAESEHGAALDDLLAAIDRALDDAAERIRRVDTADLAQPRAVGRKNLPTTVQGLLVHIAEHTQRHLGQAITTAKLARATAAQP
jgi:uncharacterized damage-inducible protein DinB